MTTTIEGVTINADAIARGILAMVPDLSADAGTDYGAALALGMLPAPLMDLLRRMLDTKAREIAPEPGRADWRARFVRGAEREIARAMYQHAEMVV